MPAVGTLAAAGVERRAREDGRVVLLRIGCGLIGDGLIHLFFRVVAAHDRANGGVCQGVVDALRGGQGHTKR